MPHAFTVVTRFVMADIIEGLSSISDHSSAIRTVLAISSANNIKLGITGFSTDLSSQDSWIKSKSIARSSNTWTSSANLPIMDRMLQFNICNGCIFNSWGGISTLDLPASSSVERLLRYLEHLCCNAQIDLGPRRLWRRDSKIVGKENLGLRERDLAAQRPRGGQHP